MGIKNLTQNHLTNLMMLALDLNNFLLQTCITEGRNKIIGYVKGNI